MSMTETSLSNEEWEALYNKPREALFARIFGDKMCKITDISPKVIVTDKNWNSGKSWMDQLRITDPMNNDHEWVGYYNQLLHDNNGVMVTVVDSFKVGFAASPVK